LSLARKHQKYLNHPDVKKQALEIAQQGYSDAGRGVVVVDLRGFEQHKIEAYYLSQTAVEDWPDAKLAALLDEYDPAKEIVLLVYHGDADLEWYKLGWHPTDWLGRPTKPL
jgi:hypothetical protein